VAQVALAANAGADRIELYTAHYAHEFAAGNNDVLGLYRAAALRAQELQMGVNAGHDLDLLNLRKFLTIPGILEVSIGHALIVECIEQGMEQVIKKYLAICTP
jgi:pyridoxine 5-phosphate synthase